MRKRYSVHEIHVVKTLVLLRVHEIAIETEQLAEGLAVMDFDVLERRTECFDQSRRPDEEAPVIGQILGHRAGREIAFRLPFRHPCPRAESLESASAAASIRLAARGRRGRPCRC